MLLPGLVWAQETIDASDPANYIVGGAQGYHFLSADLLEVQLVDVEPEIDNALSFEVDPNTLEAGLPVFSASGGGVNEDLWLNITSRTAGLEKYQVRVYGNQPLPPEIEIQVQVVNATSVGGVGDTGTASTTAVTLSETPTVLISDIGRGFTTDGINKGFQLRYTITNLGGGALPVGFEVIYDMQLQI